MPTSLVVCGVRNHPSLGARVVPSGTEPKVSTRPPPDPHPIPPSAGFVVAPGAGGAGGEAAGAPHGQRGTGALYVVFDRLET